ncbi:hypothetical protein PVAND_004286 [Polypedilum vanderplanki]|uniref:Uncharacterized protein n=1 Tax=Polypedilum vanderplanki TaxID=319348 RepID=A0A9J6BWP1_POLVA|nr:hypothetical protein PVAND_004286 [Polypedilum vanderplanki]
MTENKEDVENDKLTDQNAIMDSDVNLDRSIEEIFHLLNNYEKLVIAIQQEAKNCQVENRELKNNLLAIIQENKKLRENDCDEDQLAKFRAEHIEVADKIFHNLRNQMELCVREKEMYENLWKRTSSVLEQEIPRNSIAKLKTEHMMETKQLRKDLIEAHSECKREKEINAKQQELIKEMLQKLETIQSENKALHDENTALVEHLKMLETSKMEIERLLDESNELNKEQMKKSTESFEKMQETIRVAEFAMAEAQHLMDEKKRIEDEYNHLAETIGSVIEQASERMDKEREEMQKNHNEEIQRYKTEIERLKHEAELERERTTSAMHQATAVKERLQSTDKTKECLGKDLVETLKRLELADKEIVKLKKSLDIETEQRKQCQYETEKLRSVIEHNRKLNLKWKNIMLDITKQVQEKIKNLMIENYELKASSRRTL